MDMLVNTIRMVDNDQVKEYSDGDNETLTEKLAIGLINPEDFKNLNIPQGSNLKLINNFGSVVIKPLQDKNVPLGTINMPVSIWANQITGIENNELIFKNIKVNVEATGELILGIGQIINSIREKS
ncbi:MAG: molybdopterin dinucleotide binding domain-containing protein [Candidatus Odinarchaeota archaeon]